MRKCKILFSLIINLGHILPKDYAMPRFDDKFLGSVKQEDKKKSNSKIPISQNLLSNRMWCSGNSSFLSVEVKHFELKQAEKRSGSLGWVTNL